MGRRPNLVNKIEQALEDKKATDVSVVYMRNNTKKAITDYYIIATANNERLLNALADVAVETIIKNGGNIHHIEGKKANSEWVLVDAYNIIVHLFTPQARIDYDLDGLEKRYFPL